MISQQPTQLPATHACHLRNTCGVRKSNISAKRVVRGVTLVETVISLGVIGLLTVAGFTSLVSASQLTRQTELRTIAVNLAQQQLETLRARSFSNLPAGNVTAFNVPNSAFAGYNSVHGLEGTFQITNVPGTTSMRQITVRVQWRNGTGTSRNTAPISSVMVTALRARGSEPGETP